MAAKRANWRWASGKRTATLNLRSPSHKVVAALPAKAALLLVGDVDQLPSVGPGQVLADGIASGA